MKNYNLDRKILVSLLIKMLTNQPRYRPHQFVAKTHDEEKAKEYPGGLAKR